MITASWYAAASASGMDRGKHLYGADFAILSPTILKQQTLNFKQQIEFHPSGKALCVNNQGFSELLVCEFVVKSACNLEHQVITLSVELGEGVLAHAHIGYWVRQLLKLQIIKGLLTKKAPTIIIKQLYMCYQPTAYQQLYM